MTRPMLNEKSFLILYIKVVIIFELSNVIVLQFNKI